MKYFLKRFGPDQHRFQAVSVQVSAQLCLSSQPIYTAIGSEPCMRHAVADPKEM